jgi:uncharacterized metal-binding protein YceD (DUF177 family)
VKELIQYDIDIYGLKDKQYVYDFESGNAFFEELEQDLVAKGHFKTHLVIDKSSTMLMLKFHIAGQVELTCDRSLELFDEPFDLTERLILKFGDHNEALSDEIELIRQDTPRINVARHIFDFIALALPMKKLHPRFRNDDLEDDEENLLVYQSSDNEQEDVADQAPQNADPRWEALRKLKGN